MPKLSSSLRVYQPRKILPTGHGRVLCARHGKESSDERVHVVQDILNSTISQHYTCIRTRLAQH